ncbi:MAG: glycosyltransferase family 2 protein [Candidatus Omnitrophota bacterium]
MIQSKILIIVPAYNESGNIKKVIKELLAQPLNVSIVVVDDGSWDATAKEAKEENISVISLPFNLGIGAAVQTGFQFALREGFDVAVQVDGDGQHDAGYLAAIIDPVIKNQADMVIGSRFLPPNLGYRSSFIRRVGIQFFSHLISSLTGVKVTDPTSGFRAYDQKMIKAFAEHYPYDFPEPEAIVLARQMNARILEVAVRMRKRETGHSSIRYLKTLYYMVKVTCAILLDMVKMKKRIE